MKKILYGALAICLLAPALSMAAGADYDTLSEMAAEITASDFIPIFDASEADGSRMKKRSFDGTATNCLTGAGTFAAFIGAEADPTVDTSAEIQAIIGAGVYEPAGTAGDITGVLGDATGDVPVLYQTFTAFTGSDATPDVSTSSHWKNADTTTITGFDGTPVDGQHLWVRCDYAGIFDITSSSIVALNRTTDYTCVVGEVHEFVYNSTSTKWVAKDLPNESDTLTFSAAGFLGSDGAGNWDDYYLDSNNFENTAGTWEIKANGVASAEIATIVESVAWNAAGTTSDGTQCADAAKVMINSGPTTYTTICADNDASTIDGEVPMPDSWDGGTVTMTSIYIQTAADTNVLNGDISCQCRGAGETPSSTWGTEVALDDAAVTGSNAEDHLTSAAMTCAGTCAGGDTLYWRYQMDATGTTTAVATLHYVGWKMEYTSNVGD